MRRFTFSALAFVLVAFQAFAGQIRVADPTEFGFSAEHLSKIDAAMQSHLDEGELSGISTLVARHGRVVQFGTYGVADLESGAPITEESVFRIYSMTKPITSAAIMMLVEQGRVELEAPVARYLPAYTKVQVFVREDADGKIITKKPERAPTIKDLLLHTAGLSYGLFSKTPVDRLYNEVGPPTSDERLIELTNNLGGLPLLYEPGTRWHYSLATDVLGRVVEVASGERLDAFFANHIFRPLKMNDTGFFLTDVGADQLAVLYGVNEDGALVPLPPEVWGNDYENPKRLLMGGAGLLSTIGDYFRFCQMLANNGKLDGIRILSQDSIDQMGTDHLGAEIDGSLLRGQGFGYGFAIVTDPGKVDRKSSLGEMSWGGMANTKFWIDRRQGIVAVAMTQRIHTQDVALDVELREIVYGAIQPELAQAPETTEHPR